MDGRILARDGHTVLAVLRGSEARTIDRPDQISWTMKHAIVDIEDRRFFRARRRSTCAACSAPPGPTSCRGKWSRAARRSRSSTSRTPIARTSARSGASCARPFSPGRWSGHWSKDQILTDYLNTIYFGNGAYGVERAARTYFGHSASKLTLPEAALLAGIPRDPGLYDPFRNPKAARARRALVLEKMVEQGDITAADARRANQAPAPPRQPGSSASRLGAGAVLHRLCERPADPPSRRGERVRRRAGGHDLDRSRAAEARSEGGRQVVARSARPVGSAGGHRSARRRDPGHGRRPQLQAEPVQPGYPIAAPGGLVVQAVRPHGGARGGHLPFIDAGLEAALPVSRQPLLVGLQQRGLLPRTDRPEHGDNLLRQHRLRPADADRQVRRRSSRRRTRSGSRARSIPISRSGSEPISSTRSRWHALTPRSPTAAYVSDGSSSSTRRRASRCTRLPRPGQTTRSISTARRRQQETTPNDAAIVTSMLENVISLRNRPARRAARPCRGRQDGNDRELRRRLVCRLHAAAGGRGLGRLSEQAGADGAPLPRPAGRGRHLPGADLEVVHGDRLPLPREDRPERELGSRVLPESVLSLLGDETGRLAERPIDARQRQLPQQLSARLLRRFRASPMSRGASRTRSKCRT